MTPYSRPGTGTGNRWTGSPCEWWSTVEAGRHRGRDCLAQPGRTLVAVAKADDATRRELVDSGAEIEDVPARDGSVDLCQLLNALGRRDVTSVLVEGGGTLLGSLFDQDLVDKVVAFISPTIFGGRHAPSPVAGEGVETITDARRLERPRVAQFGPDIAVIGYCQAGPDVHRHH